MDDRCSFEPKPATRLNSAECVLDTVSIAADCAAGQHSALIPTQAPRILLVASLRWTLAARYAIAFHELGCTVQAWCPREHPLEKTTAVAQIYRGSFIRPLQSLRAAIVAARPDLIIPCDDNAAIHLSALYERSLGSDGSPELCNLIARSLGTPGSMSLAGYRDEVMRLAASEGIRIPCSGAVASLPDLDAWDKQHGFPAVLKTDHSWGGQGVAVVKDLQSAYAAFNNAMHPPLLRAFSHWILRRDPSYLLGWFSGVRPSVSIQSFVAGRPANRAVACWNGEVLAGISAVALQTRSATGPATVMSIVENAEMSESSGRIVRAMGLSGFCGVDFVIEEGSGAAYLIELNPRATPLGHLPLGTDRDLPAALLARLNGKTRPPRISAIAGDIVAMFPDEWYRNPHSSYLRTAYHDVPWTQIDLVRECMALPWQDRGLAARLRARLLPRR